MTGFSPSRHCEAGPVRAEAILNGRHGEIASCLAMTAALKASLILIFMQNLPVRQAGIKTKNDIYKKGTLVKKHPFLIYMMELRILFVQVRKACTVIVKVIIESFNFFWFKYKVQTNGN